jgi:hypothetical protein
VGIRKEEDTLLVWHGGNVGYAPILLPPNCVMDEDKVAALPPIEDHPSFDAFTTISGYVRIHICIASQFQTIG